MSRIGSARGARAGLKAWPSLRVRCSGGLAETLSIFTTKNTKLREISNQENRNREIGFPR
jgi:hypothetical protein